MVVLIAKLKGILFGRYVWITNTVSGGILLSVGDFIQQNIEHKENPKRKQQQKYDLERSGHMMIVGLGLGWTHNFWYTFLDRVLPGAALMTVAKKVILDQTISSPFSNWFFFMGCGLLEGNTAKSSWEEFTDKFAMVYKTDCSVWPPAQVVNFLYVPPVYRAIYVNIVTVAWNVFLSYAKHCDKGKSCEADRIHTLPVTAGVTRLPTNAL